MTTPTIGSTVYCSKYALTDGIKERTLRLINTFWCDGAYVYLAGSSNVDQRVVGRDIHATIDEALVAANKQRDREITSLRKQIAKLEALTFRTAL